MSERNLRPYFTPTHFMLILFVIGILMFSMNSFYQRRQRDAERAQARELEEQQAQRDQAEKDAEAAAFVQQIAATREQALGERNQVLLAVQSLQKDVTSFENTLRESLGNDVGRRIASSPEMVRRFHRLRTGKRPDVSNVTALLKAIPGPEHYAPKGLLLFEPSDEDLRALQEQSARVINLRNLLVEDENSLAQLIRDAELQEPSDNTLQDALIAWQEEVTRQNEPLEEHRRKQGDIIQTGAVFRGRYDYPESSLKEPTSLYTLTILSRRGNGFEAKFTLERGVSIYSEGEIEADNIVFRNYSKKEEMDSRKSSKVDSIYRGKIDGVVWSGDCSYSTYRHEVQGTFYSQLIVDDKFMDIVYKPRDRFAIGAKWVGSVKQDGNAAEPMTLVVDKRSRNLFRGTQLPSNAQILTGSLDGKFVRWSSLNEARIPVNYEGVRRDKVISGNATWLIDGVPCTATFELDFDCIEPRLWRLRD